MILVAPSIPAYRSEPLEHFGIRCAEIGFPEDTADSPEDFAPAIPAQRVATVIRKSDWISNAARQTEGSFTTTDLLPPATREAREMAHELLLDGLVAMEELFLQFEIMPIRMGHVERPDLLCILGPHDAVQLLKVGIWWAYAFGASEQMAKNDTPNLSVNALPWGLDFAINAELMTSQRVLLSRVTSAPDTFNKLVAEHGNLELQVWLKIEFRPRFYHWISLNRVAGDARAAESLLERHQEAIRDYEQLKSYWVNRLSEPDAKMSAAELLHMRSRNQNPNIALRVVRTFAPGDAVWGMDVEHQKQSFRDEYAALKPLIEFFN